MRDSNGGPPPARNFGAPIEWLRTSPGARKLEQRKRRYRSRHARLRYAELNVSSAFSFLDGASQPEDLVARAAELGLPALALSDRSGVYGAPRLHKAATEAGLRAIVGAEIVLADRTEARPRRATRHEAARRALEGRRLALLARDRRGYRNLCRLLTAAARDRPKGDARIDLALLREHAPGLHCLTGGAEGMLAHTLADNGIDTARELLVELRDVFEGHLHVELQRHGLRAEEQRNRALVELARGLRLPLVATNGVRYARRDDKPLYDVLTCARHFTHVDSAGRRLDVTRERHLKSAREMFDLFRDLPEAVMQSVELAEQLAFGLEDLGYRFPDYPLPPGETPSSYLRQVTWNEARARFRPLTVAAQRQLEKELAMIEKLDLAGYFLIVWDLVRFCKREGILVQGRGSAANSAVCYALSITAVDPVRMELLFERFLSEERGEWPDIDLDLPSGAPREKVIQYVYSRYGPHGAAMTANVITYRDKLASREVGKALGFATEQIDRLSKRLGRMRWDASRGDRTDLDDELRAAGLDPDELRVRHFVDLWTRLKHLPRHLGQHSGGMVMAHGRLDEVVPLEPASMPGRVVVQWDKDDCADLGIIKVDLLGLGMLNALEEAAPLIRRHEGVHVDYAHLPADDPETFAMLRAADTVGVFQVESRAQMASLPRNAPERFYDLVVQVAIIRPGPIVGGMVHPFFERRRGRLPVEYPHPSLRPILERTLGVPLFQEQLLRIAMVAAGFSGGEAEELRRAMGFKRSMDRMEAIERRLRDGMHERGLQPAAQDQIVQQITSFALYGFPESHAASFALLAYASAYLKAHHPTAFFVSLLNAWPMGFYHPATLIQDAKRRGVEVRPVDIAHSDWRCTWEANELEPDAAGPTADRSMLARDGARLHIDRRRTARRDRAARSHRSPPPRARGALRLGLRYVRGLAQDTGLRLEAERACGPFASLDELAERCRLEATDLDRLAYAGALGSFDMSRREALWQAKRVGRATGPLLRDADADARRRGSPLAEMTRLEETLADYRSSGVTVGAHPMVHLRTELRRAGVVSCAELERLPAGRTVTFAGAVIVRQRPGTAKGLLFVTLEDETGMAQAVIMPDLLRTKRDVIVGHGGLVVEGLLQRRDGSLSVRADRLWPIENLEKTPSYDFR
ncbi:MAG: error-prone DNA polymerase [Acidobacteriota bacterium]